MTEACCFCKSTTAELRRYGPSGAPICFACMKSSPEREAECAGRYMAMLDANEAISETGAVVLDNGDMRPLSAAEAATLEAALEAAAAGPTEVSDDE